MKSVDNLVHLEQSDTNQPVVLTLLQEEAVTVSAEGRRDDTIDKHDEVVSLKQQHEHEEEEAQTQPPHQDLEHPDSSSSVQYPPQQPTTNNLVDDDDDVANDEDAVGRAQLIASMKLDENKEGGDDPFTDEEKAMLDEGGRKIKAAIADSQKTKVRNVRKANI
jgi:hypothetical protein